MIKDIGKIKIGSIWNQGTGSTDKEEFHTEQSVGGDTVLTKPLEGNITLIRLKDGVAVLLEDVTTETELECTRCLTKFTFPVYIHDSEHEFSETMPERGFDPYETFLINKQDMSIDMTESLRQEIILHFPMIPVCSERCKGLCTGCHVNLNGDGKTPVKHLDDCPGMADLSEPTDDTQKPFANLKDLFKNN